MPRTLSARATGGPRRGHPPDRGVGLRLRRRFLEPGLSHQRSAPHLPQPDGGHLPQMASVGFRFVGLDYSGLVGLPRHRRVDELWPVLKRELEAVKITLIGV